MRESPLNPYWNLLFAPSFLLLQAFGAVDMGSLEHGASGVAM